MRACVRAGVAGGLKSLSYGRRMCASRTSIEPGRTKAYSSDIGWRIIWQRTGMGFTFREIAERLHISVGTAHRIYARFVYTGDVAPCDRAKRPESRKLDEYHELFIIALICNNPTLYLQELCHAILEITNVTVSASTVCRVLRRNGLSRKKIQQTAKQRSIAYRGDFMAYALQYPYNFFVWTDEMGTDRRDQMRNFGYALRGERAICHRILTRGTRVSVMAAMTAGGVLAYECTTGSVNAEKFFDFLRGCVIPNMQPFPAQNSTLVLDNCSIHHAHSIENLLNSLSIPVLFLPPYSPDYNPIEELFSYVKSYLKRHDDIIEATNDPLPIINSAFQNVSKSQCKGWISHSGYL